ncbi:MAG: hypothetical protein WAU07_01665 [Microgenomates group bacterium]
MPKVFFSAILRVVRIFSAIVVFGATFATLSQVNAQSIDDFGVAHHLTVVSDVELQDGMVVSQRDNHYTVSNEPYDKSMLGVVNLVPTVEVTTSGDATTTPVISAGTVEVRVNGTSGPIEVGNRITTSERSGEAMKANRSGFTLGIAEEAFSPTQPDDVGTIKVKLDIKFTFAEDSPNSEKISARLLDVVSLSAIAALEEPKEILQYVIGGITLLGSVTIGFFSFTRTAQKGIDALGRNPLAKNSISFSIFANIGISFVIIAAGIAGAYFVITL